MVCACNPSTKETEEGELGVPDQPGLQSKTLSIEKSLEVHSPSGLSELPSPLGSTHLPSPAG
jgi:hypothetical protein